MDTKNNPMIVQSDSSVLLETDHPGYEKARDGLARFAELVKSPEHIHTYNITPLSIWNACSIGMKITEIKNVLKKFSRYEVPENVFANIEEYASRFGLLTLERVGTNICLTSAGGDIFIEICRLPKISRYFCGEPDENSVVVHSRSRGNLKLELIKLGFPVDDKAGYIEGEKLPFRLRKRTLSNEDFCLRDYQKDSTGIFYAGGSDSGGSGVIVLPCGAGKTIVGMSVMDKLQTSTLIITANITALRQWISELVDKTTLTPDDIGEYSGYMREIRPVTIATYQILVYRKSKTAEFPHLKLFESRKWGLIIYDEVHLLPAPVFRITADIQATRRLGLTATLIREDHREDEVFSLIGPKKYDVPWKVLEKQGWIAQAECYEVKIPLNPEDRITYITSTPKKKYRLAAENSSKSDIVCELLSKHRDDQVLIIGQYLNQLNTLQRLIGEPIITGHTPAGLRGKLYEEFRSGKQKVLIVSRVANFAVDLPDANVAIQISGSFGSRQEEAQRLGRILRPKKDGNIARFYSLVSRDTREMDFAAKRQLFLTEQGYRYHIYTLETFLKNYLNRDSGMRK